MKMIAEQLIEFSGDLETPIYDLGSGDLHEIRVFQLSLAASKRSQAGLIVMDMQSFSWIYDHIGFNFFVESHSPVPSRTLLLAGSNENKLRELFVTFEHFVKTIYWVKQDGCDERVNWGDYHLSNTLRTVSDIACLNSEERRILRKFVEARDQFAHALIKCADIKISHIEIDKIRCEDDLPDLFSALKKIESNFLEVQFKQLDPAKFKVVYRSFMTGQTSAMKKGAPK